MSTIASGTTTHSLAKKSTQKSLGYAQMSLLIALRTMTLQLHLALSKLGPSQFRAVRRYYCSLLRPPLPFSLSLSCAKYPTGQDSKTLLLIAPGTTTLYLRGLNHIHPLAASNPALPPPSLQGRRVFSRLQVGCSFPSYNCNARPWKKAWRATKSMMD